MKRLLAAVFVMLVCAGCAKQEKPAITIGKITVSAAEFEQAYQNSQVTNAGSLSRKEFLDLFVSRKLMLREAEALGLDKDPKFLASLQVFWEQSLLKLVLARKLNELAIISRVSEQEIADYYQRHKDTDFADKELAAVHDQIKLLIFKIKQRLELQRWNANLRKQADVKLDYDLLRISKEQ